VCSLGAEFLHKFTHKFPERFVPAVLLSRWFGDVLFDPVYLIDQASLEFGV